MNIKQLKETAQQLFSDRTQYLTLLQELAENFYPQRADFTVRRELGDEYADNLMTSYPLLAQRELGNQLGVMLRPTEKEWFKIVPQNEENNDLEGMRWLEWASGVQRRAMYDPAARFDRATKEADHDFSAFGQAVISVQPNRMRNGLLYRTWHLRDVAWKENSEGDIGLKVRKWKPTLYEADKLFPGKVHSNVTQRLKEHPFEKINCYHIICEADMYDGSDKERKRMGDKPFWSIYYDVDNDHVMEEIAVYNDEYVIPRWQTVSGSQYAFSPASIAALPDARLIQAMTYTLLQAGEKAVDPPLIATQDAVRSDVNLFAGGITWVSEEYDEKLGASLRPISQDTSGIPLGMDMAGNSQMMIREAFYLNKLAMPERGPEMTAYEVGQRIQEYIRGAIPIFAPMEPEYNGALCEKTFDLMMRMGAFGSPQDMPDVLSGMDYQFKFESPLHDAIEQQKGQKFIESQQLIAEAAALDQTAPMIMNTQTALRDALIGIGTPTEWVNSEEDVMLKAKQLEMQQQAQATLEAMQQGADVAKTLEGVGGLGGGQ